MVSLMMCGKWMQEGWSGKMIIGMDGYNGINCSQCFFGNYHINNRLWHDQSIQYCQ